MLCRLIDCKKLQLSTVTIFIAAFDKYGIKDREKYKFRGGKLCGNRKYKDDNEPKEQLFGRQ